MAPVWFSVQNNVIFMFSNMGRVNALNSEKNLIIILVLNQIQIIKQPNKNVLSVVNMIFSKNILLC